MNEEVARGVLGTRTAAFDQACGMERPLEGIRNFALTLDRVAQTLDDDNAAAIVQEIALAIQARVDELDEIHAYFFRLHGGPAAADVGDQEDQAGA
jgi:hypothetical protein